ncbi:MAG: recombination-associated protein RdgC [Desulfomonile tiedjei]|uniref:Recombination-associated protein RdgC n=1 Tax=Desulfomonile tiedjei TaxID=2358 RepID=A0A9D6Z1N9_9BACT|nr:recombination-associated protein RdgC [Desulfomonile tiedjei]
MGLASRSVSMMRYRVRGETSGSFWDAVDEGVRKGAFREIDSPGDELGMGWVSMEDFTDIAFSGASYVRGNYIALSLRVDTVRVPPKILEIHVKQESRKLLEQSGRQRLSSAQRRELKERVKESLKKQAFPSIQVFDLIWDTSKAVVYFGTHSVKPRERLEAHFKKCFGLTLIPLLAYIRAEELLEGRLESQILEKLKPCSMAP